MATMTSRGAAPSGESKRKRIAWLGCALVGAVALVYANSWNAPFIFDDFQAITLNPTIRDLSRISEVLTPPLDAAGATGRPLVNLSFALNYALGGLDVRGFHIGSMLLHALGTLLFFGVLRRTFQLPAIAVRYGEHAIRRAWWIALLWAVHPLLTESVVCVMQRNEVLAGLFYFLTLYGFVRSVERLPAARGWQAVSVVACLLGMASKEIMATAPLLVFLFDRTFVGRTFSGVWRERKKYYGALAATWLLLAFLMARTEQRAGIVGFGLGMSSWEYLVTQCRAIVLYLKLSLLPHPLVVDYGHTVFRLVDVWREAVLVVALLAATGWALWRRPRVGFLGAWFFVILAPSSSFVPLTTQTIAEHRMYLPLAAIVAGLVFALEGVSPRRWMWMCAILVVAGGVLTVRRNAEYRDELGFWQATLEYQPKNARIYANLGDYYRRQQRWEEAAAAFRQATELRENFAYAHSELGAMLLETGRVDEALAQHRIALQMRPDDAVIHYNLGVAYERAGDLTAAVSHWQEALRLRPAMGAAMRRLGSAALKAGNIDEAIARFKAAAANDRFDAEALDGWGRALTVTKKFPEAVERLEAARALRPEVAEIHYNLGNARFELNQLAEAARLYREALRLKPSFLMARHNLALALLQQGRASEAVDLLAEVVQQRPAAADVRLNFSLALEQAGRIAEALVQASEATRLDSSSERARELVRRLESATPRPAK